MAEGEKSVLEVLNSDFIITELFVTEDFLNTYSDRISQTVHVVTPGELGDISSLKSNRTALALVEMKPNTPFDTRSGTFLMLDKMNDPGNLGTVIRVADWYGIDGIIASGDTTDLYNPKVISASKGSFTRVPVFYTDLESFISDYPGEVYAADMSGDDVHDTSFPADMILLMGNESHGISPVLKPYVHKTITIPSYGQAESLNVGVATAVICDNIRRTG